MEIVCNKSGYKAVINFKPYSWSNKEVNKVEGFIYDNKFERFLFSEKKRRLNFTKIVKLNRKNKVKALYGYWSHCLYSCDAHAYEAWMKSNKPLPLVQLDSHFNVINSEQNRALLNGSSLINTHSFNDLAGLGGKDKDNNNVRFNLNTVNSREELILNSNTENNENVLNGKKTSNGGETGNKLKPNSANAATSPAFASLSIKHTLTDLVELWRVIPRPPYCAEVRGILFENLNEGKPEIQTKMSKI
jgi:hypothetical protein